MDNQPAQPEQATKLTDSPWFWGYLFCTVGLVFLVIVQPKLVARQQEIDREGYARQVAMDLPGSGTEQPEVAKDDPVTTPQPTPKLRLIHLYIVFAVALVIAWARLWWVHFGKPNPRAELPVDSDGNRPAKDEVSNQGDSA